MIKGPSILGFVFLLAILFDGAPVLALSNEGLERTQVEIERHYAEVDHITVSDLASTSHEDVILFDVRAEKEFAVSRIAGAIRVSSRISIQAFMKQYASDTNGKTVVFYCSVGHRSSKLASRVQDGLLAKGAIKVANLKGGIFEWHNEGRPLINDTGPTDRVHPYNRKWGKLLNGTTNP